MKKTKVTVEKRRRENQSKQETPSHSTPGSGSGFPPLQLIGSRHFLNQINAIVERTKHSKSTILITGETGVGKSLVARYMFHHSQVYKTHLRSISLAKSLTIFLNSHPLTC